MANKTRVWRPCEPLYNRDGGYMLNRFYQEINFLHRCLREAGIPYERVRLFDGWQILYPSAESPVISVIEHIHSYGHDKDLLEIDGLLTFEEMKVDTIVGWLTARDVFARIEAHWKKVKA